VPILSTPPRKTLRTPPQHQLRALEIFPRSLSILCISSFLVRNFVFCFHSSIHLAYAELHAFPILREPQRSFSSRVLASVVSASLQPSNSKQNPRSILTLEHVTLYFFDSCVILHRRVSSSQRGPQESVVARVGSSFPAVGHSPATIPSSSALFIPASARRILNQFCFVLLHL